MLFSSAHAAVTALVAGLVLVPFGPLSERLSEQNPSRGFDAEEAKLLVVRAQRVPNATCAAWVAALEKVRSKDGMPVVPGDPAASLAKAWGPFTEEELKDIQKCDGIPCGIKLGPDEIARMDSSKKDTREAKFLELVKGRVERYRASGERKEYEYPGDPVDPWPYLAGRGFKTDIRMPSQPGLFARKLEFAPGRAKTLHQVLDRRFAAATHGRESVLWVRDAYTDHYFDSWGEWIQVSCEEKAVTVVQALFLEFDLLKKTDLVSRIMRGKMRSGVEEQGQALLDRFFAELEMSAIGSG